MVINWKKSLKPKSRIGLTALCLGLLTIWMPRAAGGQMPAGQIANSSTGNSTATVKTESRQYLIGSGDVLGVSVYNRPQLSVDSVRVDERGMIRLPLLADEIRAGCRTETELAQEISRRYLEYLREPHVEVFIKDFQAKPVAVIGAVRAPGRFQLQRPVRLLELISFAGGPSDVAGGHIQVKHDPTVTPCDREIEAEKNGKGTRSTAATRLESVSWYELNGILADGTDEDKNPYVHPGDIINLIEADKVYVVGNVYRPTTIPIKNPVRLSEAIAMAGGTLPDTNLDRIRLMRQAPGGLSKTEFIYDLKAINRRKADDVPLQANDIIEVPSSNSKKFVQSLLDSVSPTISRLPMRVIP